MRQALSAVHTPIDVGSGGVVLANMLAAWLDGNPRVCLLGRRLMNPKIQAHHRSKPAYIYFM
jgi:hypothetical protein